MVFLFIVLGVFSLSKNMVYKSKNNFKSEFNVTMLEIIKRTDRFTLIKKDSSFREEFRK